ncbi:hypothetical protein R2601_10894, partial [Salipiger bermudensis HTCC2601]
RRGALYCSPRPSPRCPGLDPDSGCYVGQIDTARLWLDGQVGALVQQFGGE